MTDIAIEDLTPQEAIKQLLTQIQELKDKIDSEYNYLKGMMDCILLEFQDHRQALILFLEANGISCDDIKGWPSNNYKEEKGKNNVTNRKSKRIFRSKNDRKQTKKKKQRRKKHA